MDRDVAEDAEDAMGLAIVDEDEDVMGLAMGLASVASVAMGLAMGLASVAMDAEDAMGAAVG